MVKVKNLLRRLKGRLRNGNRLAQSPSLTLREFKEQAWQSDKAVGSYLEATAQASLGMEDEVESVLCVARGRVLDVGAGTGRFSVALAEAGRKVFAADLSAQMLQAAVARSRDRVRGVRASAFALPFADNSFDTVISFWLLVHFPEWREIVREMLRVARPGASVVFETQSAWHIARARQLAPSPDFFARLETQSGFHVFAMQEEVAQVARECGAEVAEARYYGLFEDNFVAQALLREQYPQWLEQIQETLQDPSCRRFWRRFERRHLPAEMGFLARKQLYVLIKEPQSDEAKENARSAPITEEQTENPATIPLQAGLERSYQLFRDTFSPLWPDLPNQPPTHWLM